jgi:hypothetical protein
MPAEEPDFKEWQTKERLKRFLSTRFRVRLHISVLLLAAVTAGWIANRALFLLGIERLLTRHVVAVVVAYCTFIAGVSIWIRWFGIREYTKWRKSREMLDAPAPSGPPPDSMPWSSLGNIDPTAALAGGGEGCLVVFVVLVLLAVLFGAGGYLIADAASFFSEIVFELLLAAGLVRRMRRWDPPSWTAGAVRKTLPALIVSLLLVIGFGLWAQSRYPDANTVAEVVKKMRADSAIWKQPRRRY